jgi:class 3 adenylate cyclase
MPNKGGEPLTGASGGPPRRPGGGGERRQATVLFADLVGFTAFSERQGEEAAYSLMQHISDLMNQAIQAHNGTIKSFTGDGIMALFGVPVALEDAPLRACRAAIDIQQRITLEATEIERKYGVRPQLRIGINTGPMIVGEMKSGESASVTAIGDTVNLASRLQALAQPGAVALSEMTYRLVQGLVESRAAGEHQIKGKVERQKVYQLNGIRPDAVRFDWALSRGLTTYVGRTRELDMLERNLAPAASDITVIDVVGEPGIGKSRLLHEFRHRVGDNRVFLSGNCTPDGRQTPFLPFKDIVRGSFRVSEGEAEGDIARKLSKGLSVLGLASQQNLGLLLNLLGLKAPEGSLKGLDGVLIGLKTRDLLMHLLEMHCRLMPTVIVLEDLHWIDSASEELLGRLVKTEEKLPLLVIYTHRPEYRSPWTGHPKIVALSLGPLSLVETSEIVRTRLGVTDLPQALAQLVTAKAEGNPLFVEEIATHLVQRAVVRRTASGMEYDAAAVAATLPSSIQGLLAARVDLLSADDRSLLQAAAVIGRRFAPDLLSAVAQPSTDVDDRLLAMRELDLIYPDQNSGDFLFKHALVRDVAYDGLLSAARIDLHLKVAEEAERRGKNRIDEIAEFLAYHYDRAGSIEKAFQYNVVAGEKSLGVYSLEEAQCYFDRALTLIESRTELADNATFSKLIANNCALYWVAMQPGKTRRLVDRYLSRIESSSGSTQVVIVYGYYTIANLFMCRYRDAASAARRSMEIAESLGDPQSRAYGHATLLMGTAARGELSFEEANHHIKQATLESDGIDDAYLQLFVRMSVAWEYFNRGITDKARERAFELRDWGRRTGDPRALAASCFLLGWIGIAEERYDEAFALGDEGNRAAVTPFDRLNSAAIKGIAQIFLRDTSRGEALLLRTLEEANANEYFYWRSGVDGPLGVAQVLRGEFGVGIRYIEQGIKRSDDEGFELGRGFEQLILSEVIIEGLTAKETPPLKVVLKNFAVLIWIAVRGWNRAVTLLNLARQNRIFSEAGLWRARIDTDLGILYAMKKRHARARSHLEEARSIAERLKITALLTKIDLTLASLPSGHG